MLSWAADGLIGERQWLCDFKLEWSGPPKQIWINYCYYDTVVIQILFCQVSDCLCLRIQESQELRATDNLNLNGCTNAIAWGAPTRANTLFSHLVYLSLSLVLHRLSMDHETQTWWRMPPVQTSKETRFCAMHEGLQETGSGRIPVNLNKAWQIKLLTLHSKPE